MSKVGQIKLILWKNFLITKRLYILTLIQILLPCVFMAILLGIRAAVSSDRYDNITTWPSCNITESPFGMRQIRIGFSPNNSFTNQMMNKISLEYPLIYEGFQTEKEMVDYSLKSDAPANIIGGIVFQANSSGSSNKWTFKIRMKATTGKKSNSFNSDSWHTDKMFPMYQQQGPPHKNSPCGKNPDYYKRGFYMLQVALTKSLLEYIQPQSTNFFNQTELVLQRHPYPPYIDDKLIPVLQQQFALFMVLSFQLIVPTMVKSIVEEKEKRLKEAMKMMGMSNWVHWFAWFFKYFCLIFVSSCIITLELFVPAGAKGSVINYTNPVIFLLFLVIYSLATISLGFLLSTLFSKASRSAAGSGILFYLLYAPNEFIKNNYDALGYEAKISTCLSSNVALAYGSQVVGMFEGQGVGVQWHNIASGSSMNDPFSMLDIMLMLLFDACIYAILTWYIESVFPGEYGIPLPWYFPFTKSYWFGTVQEENSEKVLPGLNLNNEFFEPEPVNLKAGIKINRLHKEFSGKKSAVAGVTFNMYEGQITALLGHNGAGKTTTISMLTGLIPPTSGTASVNGYDICKDIGSVRQSLGICPQHDILFKYLTVEEHLQFFAMLKGCPSDGLKEECDKMLESIGLKGKKDNLPGKLSGGMKRKLSLGIALIGGSKIVILDEPSSGLDPNARRQIWSLIQNNRAGRTMLLTTHFMDEADCLGDRIAIMSEGVLKCCGSTLFLKSKYGAGYHLVMVKEPECNMSKIDQFIKSSIPRAKMESNIGAELSYLLPHESCSQFQEFFKTIDSKREELDISSYGVSITTMEEVFLRVSQNQIEDKIEPEPTTNSQYSSSISLNKVAPVTFHRNYLNRGIKLKVQQFLALLMKNVLNSWRNKLFTVGHMILVILFVIMAALTVLSFPTDDVFKPLVLEPMAFGKNFIPFSRTLQNTNETMDISNMYGTQFPAPIVFENINKMPNYETEPDIMKYLGKVGAKDLPYYNEHYQIAADFGYQLEDKFISYFNAKSYHSGAISVSIMASALLKYFHNNDSSLVFINHPLPKSNSEKLNNQVAGSTMAFTISLFLLFGISFLISSFSVPLIKERISNAKHLEYVSGASSFNYWMASYIWDISVALIPCILILAIFKGFDIEGYHGEEHSAHIFLLFLMYIISVLPLTYLLSLIFKVPSTGQTILTLFNLGTGVITLVVVMVLSIPTFGLADVAKQLIWVFMVLFPQFCLGQGLITYYSNYAAINACSQITKDCSRVPANSSLIRCCLDRCGDNCIPMNENYLGWKPDGIGRMLFFMALQSVVYFSILLFVESTFIRRIRYRLTNRSSRHTLQGVPNKGLTDEISLTPSDEITIMDEDVQNEQHRIMNGLIQHLILTDLVVINDVCKRYQDFTAVNRIGVGIPRGECFGLLGVNGAGKTSVFKMLTGDEMISAGQIYINRLNVKSDMKKIHQEIGYCPQFDALIETMTGREILTMFAHLRGVHMRQIKLTVDELLNQLMLDKYADKTLATYSGGNKRKLSTAVALMGDPPLVLLDEPTTGMDPGTRRKLWNVLIGVRDSGRTLILTSHSMDECEALCTRLAIMVNGNFRCLGSPQHLKSKFGDGYTLVAKMSAAKDPETALSINSLRQHIEEKFPGCKLKDIHQDTVHYQIGKDISISWADLFGTLEQIKETYNLEAYSIGQASLEQVFINFARSQRSEKEPEKKSWKKKICCK